MTNDEIKIAYLEWIERYCNNEFSIDNPPGGVKLALNLLTSTDPLQFNVTSEKLSDMSQTFANDGGIPKVVLNYLTPYKRLRSL